MAGAQRGRDIGAAARDRAEAARRRAEERERRARRRRAAADRSRAAPRRRARRVRRRRSRGSRRSPRARSRARARRRRRARAPRPRTPGRTRSASCGSRPNGIDGVATRRAGGAARSHGASGGAIAIGVEHAPVGSTSSALMRPARRRARSRRRRPSRRARATRPASGVRSVSPSSSRARLPSPVQPCRMRSTTCGASAAPATSDARADRAPQTGAAPGNGTRPPRRAACHGVAAPRTDDVARAVEAVLDRRDHRERGVVGMQERERRIGDRAHRHDRQAQQPAERARHVRAEHRRVPQRADRARRMRSATPLAAASTASSERPYGVVGRGHRVFVGNRDRGRSAVRRPRARCAARRTRARPCSRPRSSVADVHASVRSRADAGVIRDAGSYTPKCATTCGAYSSTNAASRSLSRGSMRRNCARRRRRRGGTKSTPTISSAHSRASISCATRVPSSPPIPVTSTRAWSRLLRLRTQVREQDHFADRGYAREQHDQPVDAQTHAAGRRQAVLERAHVVGVDAVRLVVAELLERGLRLEPPQLVDRDRSAR